MPDWQISEEEARDWAEYFVRATGRNTLHLPAQEATFDEPLPLCGISLSAAGRTWTSKPISAFPPEYASICSNCLEELIVEKGRDPFGDMQERQDGFFDQFR